MLTTTRGRFCITAPFGSLDGGHQIYQRPPTTRAGPLGTDGRGSGLPLSRESQQAIPGPGCLPPGATGWEPLAWSEVAAVQ
ncbi:hypothetical protein GCM10009744_59050 [Kribbella alba]|uniref:Uncharacterized protein n=1 Tax=Kribbella alba TaxID=190197 RepID=A0ABN2FT09_9ACTN